MKAFTRVVGLPGVSNFGYIIPISLYRCAQPEDVGFEILRNIIRVKTIINLRSMHSDEKQCKKLGLQYLSYPMTAFLREIPQTTVSEILSQMANPENQPVVVHCAQGHDRTGAICACFRMVYDKWTIEEAMEEMKAYGYNTLLTEMRETVEEYSEFLKNKR